MRISNLEELLAAVKADHGDLEVFCSDRPIGALVVLPVPPQSGKVVSFKRKVASLVPKERRRDPRRPR
jgi:hypothetical protein